MYLIIIFTSHIYVKYVSYYTHKMYVKYMSCINCMNICLPDYLSPVVGFASPTAC